MDVFSHALWATVGAQAMNLKRRKLLRVWMAALWGVFPDVFAFAIPFVWLFWHGVFLGESVAFPRPDDVEPVAAATSWVFSLAAVLYNYSHSLVIFAIVFVLTWILLQRPVWEMGGWLLHILIDIPTHSYRFYPTPALWPLSGWKFNGFSWAEPWFIGLSYGLFVLVYFLLWRLRRRRRISV